MMDLDRYIKKYCIVRSQNAGVFAGFLEEVCLRREITRLTNARRIWYWDGASSLSELAEKGTSRPENCKFPVAVSEVLLFGVIEILPCTDEARLSIERVEVWTQH